MKYEIGVTFEEAMVSRTCVKCGAFGFTERHHVLYGEAEQIVRLCIPCHDNITRLNTKVSQKKKRKLTDKARLYIWDKFISGEWWAEV